ncbi:MAG: ATP-binding protein [Lachnospiraceae bacterium]
MKRIRKSGITLYKKLVLSYVLFSGLLIVLLVVSILLTSLLRVTGNLNTSYSYEVTDDASCRTGLSGITNLNGWVEKLDEQYQVIEFYGEKPTDAMGYTPQELFQLISSDENSQVEYIGFLNQNKDEPGYYLVQYDRSEIESNPSVIYSSDKNSSIWDLVIPVMFLLIYVGTCFLMGTYLSRRIRRPLAELSSAMNRVKAGEEGVVLNFKTEAEFAEIQNVFNIMTRSLAEARQEKEDAETKKNKMLLELSHDIRTPISTITSFAVALEQDMVKEEDKPRYYQTIHLKAERVASLADDMFMMLKMKSNDYLLQKSNEDICEFLRRQCAEYYQVVQEKRMEMSIEIPEEEILYEADYALLTRVIGNLLANAMKYNRTGSNLKVRLEEKDRQVIITIADDGEAIAPKLREKLFDDFTRGDSARKSDGGTGLGLSISKAIVEKHKGSISYGYRDGENCFTIVLR